MADTDEVLEQKRRFAAAFLRTENAYQAAREVFNDPRDSGARVYAQMNWLTDSFVCEEMDRIAREAPRSALPTLEDAAREIYRAATQIWDRVERVKALKTYCDVMGFGKEKADDMARQMNVTNVLMIPAVRADWEQHGIEQQRRLVNDAASDD